MAHTTTDTFVGDAFDGWSMPSSWRDITPPTSNPNLNINLNHNSTEDLGTRDSPLQVRDVMNTGVEGDGTTMNVSGFLLAKDMTGVSTVHVQGATGQPGVHITGNADGLGLVEMVTGGRFSAGSPYFEIGQKYGDAAFHFLFGHAPPNDQETLILDHPAQHHLSNPIAVNADILGTVKIELGHIKFDAADLLPPVPGQPRQVQLTNNGQPVYTLDNVTLGGGGTFNAVASYGGVDPHTGFNTLLIHSG